MTTINVGPAVVTVTRTALTYTSVNFTVTISFSDAVVLNGTYMECNGDRLYISANLPSKYFLFRLSVYTIMMLFDSMCFAGLSLKHQDNSI